MVPSHMSSGPVITISVSVRNSFFDDRQIFLDSQCNVLEELDGDFVTLDDNCQINILMMCNGVVNCDDCVDEVYENCMQFECAESNYSN